MIPPNGDPPARSARLWLIAAFALCCFPIVARTAHPLGEQLFLPITPLDRTDGNRAKQWAFLESCRSHLPSNAVFTILADDPDTAMSLFMMSIGAFPYSLPLPTSYYRMLMPEVGRQADFVLAYRCSPPADWHLRLVANVQHGAIYARVAAP
jgi:hypothetical protein